MPVGLVLDSLLLINLLLKLYFELLQLLRIELLNLLNMHLLGFVLGGADFISFLVHLVVLLGHKLKLLA